MDQHIQRELFDREGGCWPEASTLAVDVHVIFKLRTADPGYVAKVVIVDASSEQDIEWSNHDLAYTVGGWAQAMSLVAWQLERGIHHLRTFG